MEENELEEGEACSGHGDDAYIDPDIALSYIDEKLQDVLGHFQKDFEGGVSAENLGAKFGGYGSFLPTYQRSPSILTQPRSPPRHANHTISRSPCNSAVESVRLNPPIGMNVTSSRNNTASTAQFNSSGTVPTTQPNNLSRKEDFTSSLSTGRCVPQQDLSNKPVNSSDQKSIKVRLKLVPDNSFAKNKAAIYYGLGLDDSPCSSPEDSPDGSLRLSPEFRDAAGESPGTILQVMTCFSIPGGYLLSPLQEHLLHLSQKESSVIRKSGIARKGIPEISVAANSSLPMRELKGYSDKKAKSDEKNGRLVELEGSNCKSDTRKMLEKEIDIETPAGQKLLSNSLNIPILSSSRDPDAKVEKQTVADPIKITSKMSDVTQGPNKTSVKDRTLLTDIPNSDQLASTESLKSCGIGNSENESARSKGKLKPKTNLMDKALERRPVNNYKDASADLLMENKTKTLRSDAISKFSSDGCKDKDNIAVYAGPTKQAPSQKASSHEKYGVKMIHDLGQVHDAKDRQKGSHNNHVPTVEPTKEILKASSSVVSIEKKKNSHAMGGHSEKKAKTLKSRKETSRSRSRESQGELVRTTHDERVEKRADLLEPFMLTGESKDTSGLKKDDHLGISQRLADAPIIAPSRDTVPSADTAAVLHPPVLIKENWVQCDKCQKWRLLPYGTDPNHLPKKWKCSMQVWLLGLNRCSVSEEETQKAMNELYLIPAPGTGASLNGHHEVALSSITSANPLNIDQKHEHTIGTVPSAEKKKYRPMDASNLPNHSSSKKNLHASSKNKWPSEANEYPLDSNSLMKAAVGVTSKSIEFPMENHKNRQKEKHIPGLFSDGGNFMAKSDKQSKSKSKREVDQDRVRTAKKFKKEAAHFLVEDRQSAFEMACKAVPIMDNGLSTTVNGKILQNCSEHSSSKDSKSETRGNLSVSIRRSKDSAHDLPSEESKEHNVLAAERSGTLNITAKKRKLKEWQEGKGHQENVMTTQHILDSGLIVKEAFTESEMRKQKKAKMPMSDEKEPTNGRLTKILVSGSRECPADQVDEEERVAGGKEPMGHYHIKTPSRRALDGTDSSKICSQHTAAATSSSSKVSGSRKSKANLHEVKGSPVESVSSSPLRIPNTEKVSAKSYSLAKDGVVDLGLSFTGSPKRCSDGEVDGGSDQSGTQRKESGSSGRQRSLEGHIATESGFLGSVRETCTYLDKEANRLSGGKAKETQYSKRGRNIDLSTSEFEETNMVSNTGNVLAQSNDYHSEGLEKDNSHIRGKLHNQHPNGSNQRKSGKSSSLCSRERNKSSEADVKPKVNDSVGDEKNLYPNKNVFNCQSEVEFNYDENSTYQEDVKDENYNFEEKDDHYLGKKNNSVKWPHANRRGNSSNKEFEDNLDGKINDVSSKATLAGSSCKSNFQENIQLAPYRSEQPNIDRSEMSSGREISQSVQPSKDKHEAHSWGPRTVPTPTRGSRSELYPINWVNKPRKPDNQNGEHAHSLRQATPEGQNSASPMRKGGLSAANVLREARDLKHTANNLKKEGLEHESIGIYFESAIKFLHYASLLEASSADNARQGELKQMMLMYSETAKLCMYCAHEYERCKEMAEAALAYKCVEVAYMKVAHYKHPSASKDRHELQNALQSALPGESPSSSASDVDNLNNQGSLDKAASTKAAASPNIAGNYVIAARNRPHFMGLLSYTNDLNCAFEATKRSQSAISAASVNLDKVGLSSVRKVLDFNYHNVEEFLRLVRLSKVSISR